MSKHVLLGRECVQGREDASQGFCGPAGHFFSGGLPRASAKNLNLEKEAHA